MRDIRGDLQDRAALLEEQIKAQEAQFEHFIEQLQKEQDNRLADLRGELEAVSRLMEHERRRFEAAAQAAEQAAQPVHPPQQHDQAQPAHQPQPQHQHVQAQAVHQPQPQHQHVQAQPQLSLADFLIRTLNEAGAMMRDDLRRIALQEGYFADADTADRGVHATLINVVKAGLIRQLPNGSFAPATVLDTIRLRRAM
jgi:hypothetical protein